MSARRPDSAAHRAAGRAATVAEATLAADFAVCERVIETGSKSFHAASLFLPRRVRDPAYALYAFCRLSDDAVDLAEGGPEARRAAVARLDQRLEALYDGRPEPEAADRALAAVAARFDLPKALPQALLEGLAWDSEGRRYESFEALTDYAARVAGAVGAMMAVLMNQRSREMAARAADLGVAMQLTNIARDVGEDARAGRIYLPLDWLREAGVEPARLLAEPRFSPELGAVVARLLREADRLYRRSEAGVARLPASCRPAIYAARYLYDAIGGEVARRGCDSVSSRAVVSRATKRRLLARALLSAARPSAIAAGLGAPTGLSAPPLRATRYLVDAVAAAPPPASEPMEQGRLGRALDVFERLQRRDAARRVGRLS